jgi:hypothetical protein
MYGMSNLRASRNEVSLALTNELLDFVESVRSLALRPNSPYEQLPFAFRAGTSAYRLLSAPPTPRAGWIGAWMMQERGRLATLLYVYFIVFQMDTSLGLISHYVKHFELIQRHEYIWTNSLEMLHH